MPYFGYSRYPMNVRTRSIFDFTSWAFSSPSGWARNRSSSSCSFCCASRRPLLEALLAGARLEVPDVAEDDRHERRGTFAPARPRDVDLADATHAVRVEPALDGVSRLAPARDLGQLVQEALVLHALQKGHHLRMRTDRVGDVQERQSHLRRDVVRDGLRERVGGVLLAEQRQQLLVEPRGGIHRRHPHLIAPRIEQEPPQLLDVREDEIEQRSSGSRPDVALQGGDRGLGTLDQLDDDGWIGFDRGWRRRRGGRRAGGWPGGILVRERRNEVTAVEDGLQCVPDQRIALAHDLQEAGSRRWRGEARRDIDEQPPACLDHRRPGRQQEEGEPEGPHRIGHHLAMTDGDVDVVLAVAGLRYREQGGDRPALDDLESIVVKAPFDVLRTAEVRLDPPPESDKLDDLCVRQGRLAPPLRLDRLFPRVRPSARQRRQAASRRSPDRRSLRPGPCRHHRSPGRRPVPRRGRSLPPRRRSCGCP